MHALITFIATYFISLPVLGVLFVLWKLPSGERKRFLVLLLGSALVTALLVKLATNLYHDPRPFVRDGVAPYFTSATDNGFPSDHATVSALLALVVYGASRKLGILLFVVAVLIGAARVIAGVHHAQDVIGGFVIAGIGYAAVRLAMRLVAREPTRK